MLILLDMSRHQYHCILQLDNIQKWWPRRLPFFVDEFRIWLVKLYLRLASRLDNRHIREATTSLDYLP